MSPRDIVTTLGAIALLALAPSTHAAPETFKIDPAHSQVGFKIRHFFSPVHGSFSDFAGTIVLDEKNLANSSVEATIQAASINTLNERRDKHLKSADFFAADSIPTLTFRSTKVVPGEGGRLKVEGILTIRGVSKPVVLDGTFLGAGSLGVDGRSAGYRAGFEAAVTVNRKDFNIVWNRMLDQGGAMLGDDVAITLGVEAIRVEPENAAAPAGGKQPEKK